MSQARTQNKINNNLGDALWFRTPCEKNSASSCHPDTKLSLGGSEQCSPVLLVDCLWRSPIPNVATRIWIYWCVYTLFENSLQVKWWFC